MWWLVSACVHVERGTAPDASPVEAAAFPAAPLPAQDLSAPPTRRGRMG
jgi:hypothetical protein